MHLFKLKELYKDMMSKKVTSARFQYQHNKTAFDILFLIDRKPFQLLFGAIGHKCAFIINVYPGFEIGTAIRPESAYKDLLDALGVTPDPTNRFKTSDFFSSFSEKIPESIPTKQPARQTTIRAAIDDGTEKLFFSHWRNNGVKGGHVTNDNIEKTRLAFGLEIASMCQERNISSCWTAVSRARNQ